MIKLVILAFLAVANAAPYYPDRYGDYFGEDLFDTHRFWTDLERELHQMDEMLASFHRHFPRSDTSVGIVGDKYKVTISLPGFDEKEIIVKAREGVLMVQANHKTDATSQSNYLAIYTLPGNIELSGVWTFENEVLTVVFPVKGRKPDPTSTTVAPTTTEEAEEFNTKGYDDREEMGHNNDNDNLDADVGVQDNKDNAILTNEIQTGVEATTYSVDLKNEVELVPVHYK